MFAKLLLAFLAVWFVWRRSTVRAFVRRWGNTLDSHNQRGSARTKVMGVEELLQEETSERILRSLRTKVWLNTEDQHSERMLASLKAERE